MALYTHRSLRDLLQAAATPGVLLDLDGSFELMLHDYCPNWTLAVIAEDGSAEGFLFPMPERRAGRHPYASAPGNRPAGAGVPEAETRPPRAATLARQTSTPIPLSQAGWQGSQPMIRGFQPTPPEFAAPLPRPPAPVVEKLTGSQGYPGGTYPFSFDLRDQWGRPTNASGTAFVTCSEGQIFRWYVPEQGSLGRARYAGLFLGARGGGVQTRQLQRVVDLSLLGGGYYDLTGPQRLGLPPSALNHSGFGRPPRPRLGRSLGRNRDVERKKARFDLQPCRIRFYYQAWVPGLGYTPLSQATNEETVAAVQKGIAFYVYPPRWLPLDAGWRFVPWVQINDVFHRAYVKRHPDLTEFTFGRGWGEAGKGVPIYAYPPDAEPEGLQIGLIQTDPSDEDETAMEGPDPFAAPDAPVPMGAALPTAPADYLFAVSDEGESGRETVVSETTKVSLTSGQFPRVKPAKTVNVLENAEFADLLANGTPAGWVVQNASTTGSGFSVIHDFQGAPGVASFDAVVTISANWPSLVSPARPVSRESVLTVVGDLAIPRHGAGSSSVFVEELGAAGAVIKSTPVLSLSAAGIKTLQPSGFGFGVGSQAWDAATASARLAWRPTSASWNQRVEIKNLALFPFAGAIRKFERLPREPANFAPAPNVPYPEDSYYAVGPAPSPPGVVVQAQEPYEVVDFEGGAWPAGWTGTGTALEDFTSTPLFGTKSWRVRDTSATASRVRSYSKSFAIDGSLANRWLIKLTTLPTFGQTFLIGTNAAHLYVDQYGQLILYRYYSPNGGFYPVVVGTVNQGDLLDLELITSGHGTVNGVATVLLGRGDAQRQGIYTLGGHNWSTLSKTVGTAVVGPANNTDARAVYDFTYDQGVPSPRGDILDRESLAPPSGETPPEIDAPNGADSQKRLFAPDDTRLHQAALFLRAGQPVPLSGEALKKPLPVKPGASYTWAFRAREVLFDAAPAAGCRPFVVTLHGIGLDPLSIGSSYGAGVSGTNPWRDLWIKVDVPDMLSDGRCYTEARITHENLVGGFFLFQDFLFSEGVYATEADRDARRTFARDTAGSLRIVLDTRTPESEEAYGVPTTDHRLALAGVRGAVGEAASLPGVTAAFSFESSEDGVSWSPPTIEGSAVPDRRFHAITADLEGDGVNTEIVPSGGLYVERAPFEATLLRADRSEFPGGTTIERLEAPPERPEWDVRRANGRAVPVPVSDAIKKLPPFRVHTYSEEAGLELEQMTPDDELVIESPILGGEGKILTIRPGQVLDVVDQPGSTVVNEGPGEAGLKRYVHGIMEIREAEVVEEAPLRPLAGASAGASAGATP